MLLFRWYNRVVDIDFYKILSEKSHMEIFWLMTFHGKLLLAQNHCVLGWIK